MKFMNHGARADRAEHSGSTPVYSSTQKQLPMLHLKDTARNNVIAVIGEFVGTFLFLFFSFAGTQVSNTPKPVDGAPPNTANLLYSALSFGFSLMVNVWAFYRVTGGLFNPAIVAGIASAGVVSALFPGDLNVGTRLGGGASISQGLFIEMFLTAQLVFVIIMLAVVKHKSTFLAPVGIGLVFFVTEMIGKFILFRCHRTICLTRINVGDYYTGGSLNPARSLGPDVINRSFPGYHWIYWVGPLLGSLLACGFFGLLKMMEYTTANPGQDYNEWEAKNGPGSYDVSGNRPSVQLSDTSTLNRAHSPTNGHGVQPQHVNGAEQV
ncbi:unnamed protein product [Aspergillus oryzae]|uniref:Unnamed protein product n=2 Tax=Aspergillus oryzae TaxID=5062 RepID=A0AAN4YAS6_ASPOZ|nr:unnamed protein product [Aspergillus oryzae]GMF90476.1 unnamed protein product [Aspergillus oryzae]GMG07493.1 unnamed protein product [Aspergillus oryzae]GMG25905.1 unnamed protein product [Aspergillus oryzae]GMG51002.1 unnamed protein product [Aspergillus oryzae var. brunneus]